MPDDRNAPAAPPPNDEAQAASEAMLRKVEDLVGKAAECETRKEWSAALELHKSVVELTQALTQVDEASLQRAIRYAAALARVGRWHEAGVHFRRSVRNGAVAKAPLERPLLLRVFSRELYAPGFVAALLGEGPIQSEPPLPPEVMCAREEAAALAHAYRSLRAEASNEPTAEPRRELLLGLCAYEAGDAERAFAHFDAADSLNDGDMATNYLLMLSAHATRSPELASITRFARDVALKVLGATDAEPVADQDLLYATLTLIRLGAHGELVTSTLSKPHAAGSLLELLTRAHAVKPTAPLAHGTQLTLARPNAPVQGGLSEQLAAWAAWREIHRSLGYPPWIIAEAFKLSVTRRPSP